MGWFSVEKWWVKVFDVIIVIITRCMNIVLEAFSGKKKEKRKKKKSGAKSH